MKISEKLNKIPNASQYGSYDKPEPEGGVQRYWSKESNAPVHPVNAESAPPSQAQPWRRQWHGQPASPDRSTSARPAVRQRSVAMDPAPQAPLSAKQRARILFHVDAGRRRGLPERSLHRHGRGAVHADPRFPGGSRPAPLTVSRPGMVTREETVVVGPGKSETVEISLQSNYGLQANLGWISG